MEPRSAPPRRPSAAERAQASFRPAFPLLHAKLRPRATPPVAISRERLLRRLTAASGPSILSVDAPPGSGKTVLLAEWEARQERPVAWLTIDDGDNDPSVLLTYLTAAIDRVHPVDASISRAIAVQGFRILATAVPRLVLELARWDRPGLLVIDDVHRITDQACLDVLGQVLDHLPAGFQVVLAGRTVSALPLGRYRAEQRLFELHGPDLALDLEETMALAAAMGEPLDDGAAQALLERTEGLAVGVYLATLDRSRRGGNPVQPPTGGAGYVADYLRSEMARSVDDEGTVLLTRTSILEVMEPSLAEAVSGIPGADERLAALAAGNQLIGVVPGPPAAYRYHALLRSYLAAELARREPGAAATLHRRAAVWYATAGRQASAVEHWLASGDVDNAARVLTGVTLRMHYGGHDDWLLRTFGAFDDTVMARHPSAAVAGAWINAVSGRPGPAERLAGIAERAAGSDPTDVGSPSIRSFRAILGAAMARHGLAEACTDAVHAAETEWDGSPWRMIALAAHGWLLRLTGDLDAADAAFAESVAAASPGTEAYLSLASRASIAMQRGDWHAATQLAGAAHDSFDRTNLGDIAPSLLVHAVAARAAIHEGDRARGGTELVHAQHARPQATHALPWLSVAALLECARAYLAISDTAGARTALDEAQRISRRRPELGTLITELGELDRRTAHAAETLVGSSTLTPAELRLLPFLSTHLTFEEIGDRLSVSRHTIKTQAMSVYGKLQTSSRSQTVERAVALGLLEPFPGLPLRSVEDD